MNTFELAKKYGVTTPNISEKLFNKGCFIGTGKEDDEYEYTDYPNTYFVWIKVKSEKHFFMASLEAEEVYFSGYHESSVEHCFPCPSLYELIMATSEKLKISFAQVLALYVEKCVLTVDDAANLYLELCEPLNN